MIGPGRDSGPDDVEILGVVGFDEEPPVQGGLAGPTETETEEVEVRFDDDPPVAAPDAAAEAPPAVDRERFLRLHADFENFKKRVDREREDLERHAAAGLIARLLPVIDNLERALRHGGAGDRDGLYEGVALIHRQLLDELRRCGLRPVETEGVPFDPAIHDAVATSEAADLPPGIVLEELQRGYRLHERLLRPALVRVSSGDPGDRSAGGPDGES